MVCLVLTKDNMRTNQWLALLLGGLFVPIIGSGPTPPPNDNFTNSSTLTGNDVTFSGTLAGATVEGDWEKDMAWVVCPNPTNSIWWNWTAPTNTILNIQVLSYDATHAPSPGVGSALVVYCFTNQFEVLADPYGLAIPAAGFAALRYQFAPFLLSLPVIAGTNYQIQFISGSPVAATF